VIHIAGTKGKGSTAAYTEKVLRDQGYRTGLFTSPHMISPCERIRINGQPLDENRFATTFWNCYDGLVQSSGENKHGIHFFQLMLIMALHSFCQESVDAAIIEVGIGGRDDVTNFVSPTVTAITLIDYDHTHILGDTLPEIAAQKAGIIKTGIPVITSSYQTPEVLDVIQSVAREKQAPLTVLRNEDYPSIVENALLLGIPGDHQVINAGMGVHLASTFQTATQSSHPEKQSASCDSDCSQEILQSLKDTFWPGRSQVLVLPNSHGAEPTLFIDGAHTQKSIEACVQWFFQHKDSQSTTVLLFNTSHNRDFGALLRTIAELTAKENQTPFDHCIFTNFETGEWTCPEKQPAELQQSMEAAWLELFPSASTFVCRSIPDALEQIRTLSGSVQSQPCQVLATGSLYLAGGILQLLQHTPSPETVQSAA